MPSSNEKEAMTIIADEDGQTTVGTVAKGMGLGRDYTTIILESLGRADYLDMTRSGKVKLLPKGYRAIGRDVESAEAQWDEEDLFECHGIRLINVS